MADAPLSRQFGGAITSPHTRAINNEYHLELTAKNTQALRSGQVAIVRAQVEAAALNLRAMGEINRSIGKVHSGLIDGFEGIIGEARYISEQLQRVDDTLVDGFETLETTFRSGFTMVSAEITRVVAALETQQISLNEIANTLSRPYETEVQELLREGRRWLEQGELTQGREQGDNRRDALRLFEEVIASKKGATNFVAWFNGGYLHWKLSEDHAKAEDCFYHSQRLSLDLGNLWHTKSLRLQAEMQYLQNRYEDAWGTIQKALNVQREYETIYNAARYAVKTMRTDDVAALLDECIELRPTTIVTIFSEEDFLANEIIFALRDRRTAAGRENAAKETSKLRKMVAELERAETVSEVTLIEPSQQCLTAIFNAASHITTKDYLQALQFVDDVRRTQAGMLENAGTLLSRCVDEQKAKRFKAEADLAEKRKLHARASQPEVATSESRPAVAPLELLLANIHVFEALGIIFILALALLGLVMLSGALSSLSFSSYFTAITVTLVLCLPLVLMIRHARRTLPQRLKGQAELVPKGGDSQPSIVTLEDRSKIASSASLLSNMRVVEVLGMVLSLAVAVFGLARLWRILQSLRFFNSFMAITFAMALCVPLGLVIWHARRKLLQEKLARMAVEKRQSEASRAIKERMFMLDEELKSAEALMDKLIEELEKRERSTEEALRIVRSLESSEPNH